MHGRRQAGARVGAGQRGARRRGRGARRARSAPSSRSGRWRRCASSATRAASGSPPSARSAPGRRGAAPAAPRQARDRAEKAFEQAQQRAQADREALAARDARAQGARRAGRVADARRRGRGRGREARTRRRSTEVASRGRPAASPPPSSAPPKPRPPPRRRTRLAVRLETEIEERVMQGTEEVRREAEERVRKLVEKVEGEAEELARGARRGAAEGRVGPHPRAGRAARGARPRGPPRTRSRPAPAGPGARSLAAAEETAPVLAERSASPTASVGRLPDLLEPPSSLRPRCARCGSGTRSAGSCVALDPDRRGRASTPAGRPSTAASTSATPGPSSSSRCSPASCARRATRTKLVVNVTDINDKIYAAAREAGEASAEFAERMTARLLRGHRSARARPARRRAAGDRDDRRDRRADRRADRGRPRLRVRRRRLLPGAQLRRLRQALQPPPRGHGPGRGGGLGLAQGGPARLRPLEGAQAGRGHVAGTRPGGRGGPPGTSSAR